MTYTYNHNRMKPKLIINQRKSLLHPFGRRKWTLRQKIIITVLSIISLGCIVLLVLPYIPHLNFLFRKPKIDQTVYSKAAEETKKGDATTKTQPELKGNRLVLPDIGVNAEIIDGKNIYVIGKNQGVWRETSKSDPTKNGNIVIAGHRFLYTAKNGGWFYNLPELKVGQKLYIVWESKTYEYEVFNTRTVLPTQIDIRNPDPSVPKKLTMYTCYPLGSTAKRFVVEAKQL